jgi:hypothetical protein
MKTTDERRVPVVEFQIDVIAAHSVRRLVELSRCAAMVFEHVWC